MKIMDYSEIYGIVQINLLISCMAKMQVLLLDSHFKMQPMVLEIVFFLVVDSSPKKNIIKDKY
jgi:hypothetical protein